MFNFKRDLRSKSYRGKMFQVLRLRIRISKVSVAIWVKLSRDWVEYNFCTVGFLQARFQIDCLNIVWGDTQNVAII